MGSSDGEPIMYRITRQPRSDHSAAIVASYSKQLPYKSVSAGMLAGPRSVTRLYGPGLKRYGDGRFGEEIEGIVHTKRRIQTVAGHVACIVAQEIIIQRLQIIFRRRGKNRRRIG